MNLPDPTAIEQPPLVEETQQQVGPPPSIEVKVQKDRPTIPGYEFMKRLGKGGMGVVWLAKDLDAQRLVALKQTISDELSDTERARFRTEAQAMARLHHANVVQVFEVDEYDGRPYFTMEYCPGGSLHEYLDRKPQPPKVCAWILEKLALGMQHAHENGIIHRDLKPANVLIHSEFGIRSSELESETGRTFGSDEGQRAFHSALRTPNSELLKITDFGLAKNLEGSAQVTGSLDVMGTPSYMAPEQGVSTRSVGVQADVWSLGVILYESITGSLPFVGADRFETFVNVCEKDPVPPSVRVKCPKDLETICLKCLRKEPRDRYPSAQALAEDLRAFLEERGISARPMSRIERFVKWVRKNPRWAAMIALFVLTLVSGTAISLHYAQLASEEAQSTKTALNRVQTALDEAERQRKSRALAQVDTLLTAEPRGVRPVLRNLEAASEDVLPLLKEIWAEAETSENLAKRLRAAMALLPVETEAVRDRLIRGMLEAPDPAESMVIRDLLEPYMDSQTESLWKSLDVKGIAAKERLRLLAALAAFAENDPRWQTLGESVLQPWLTDNPLFLATWTDALRPVRSFLIPSLQKVYRGEMLGESRYVAATILADYASDRPEVLVKLIQAGDDRQFNIVFPVLEPHRTRAVELLRREVTEFPVADAPPDDERIRAWKPTVDDARQQAIAKNRSSAALGLMLLGDANTVWPVLKSAVYPETRTRLIHRFAATGTAATTLIERLKIEPDVGIRRALILSLGQYSEEQLPAELRQPLIDLLLRWYRDDPDPGIHGAIAWLLLPEKDGKEPRKFVWGQGEKLKAIDAALAGRVEKAPANRSWFVNTEKQTFAVVDSREPFPMSSPVTDAVRFEDKEALHWRSVNRKFAVATKSVTLAEFQRFCRETKLEHVYTHEFAPEPDGPTISVTWYEAIQYCRWLSEREGIPESEMVYPTLEVIEKAKAGGSLELPRDYLKRKGYRLLTESEWEYAARSGTRTPYYFGGSIELLREYGWYTKNTNDERTFPVGEKKPNELGLFDVAGNIYTWTQSRFLPYPSGTRMNPALDAEDEKAITDEDSRVLRGGSFIGRAAFIRSSDRYNAFRPSFRYFSIGFRIGRTME